MDDDDDDIVLNLGSAVDEENEEYSNFKASKPKLRIKAESTIDKSNRRPQTKNRLSDDSPKRKSGKLKNVGEKILSSSSKTDSKSIVKRAKNPKSILKSKSESEKSISKSKAESIPDPESEAISKKKAKLVKKKRISTTGDDTPSKNTPASKSISTPANELSRKGRVKIGVKRKIIENGNETSSKTNLSPISKKKKSEFQEDVFSGDGFSSLADLDRKLVERLEKDDGFGFTRMTAVQKLVIPSLLAGKDCFVKSQTGSGKTLAYAVPCVQKLSAMEKRIKRQDGPYAIVLTPTRELTIQTYEVFEKLLKAFIWIVPGYISGGEKRKSEKARLRKGINVLVCTPGRLVDHLKHTENLSLANVHWMIYDEADRLLDGGFQEDIRSIIDRLRQVRLCHCQSVLLSATMNRSVSQLAQLALVDPVFLTPTSTSGSVSEEGALTAAPNDAYVLPESLQQSYVVMPAKQRLLTLIALILSKLKSNNDDPCKKMLVFLNTQDTVDFHYYLLDHMINGQKSDDDDTPHSKKKRKRLNEIVDEDGCVFNVEIYRLHGNMSQQERTAVYKEFGKAKKALLLATDVAARGLHIPQLDCIVQYNTPGVAAEYVHRVGRTARMGRTGSAILFLLPSELPYLDVLKEYNIQMREMKQSEFMDCLKSEVRIFEDHLPEAMHQLQTRCQEFVYSREDVYEMATKAFVSFVRAYATYPYQLKSIFNVRSLHLGHLAKCFALEETPKELASWRSMDNADGRGQRGRNEGGRSYSNTRQRQRPTRESDYKRGGAKSDQSFKRRKSVDMSEHGSGLDSISFS